MGDQFHNFQRSKHKMDQPLEHNVVNENIRLFIRHNLLNRDQSDNVTQKRLIRNFAQHLIKYCIDHLKLLLSTKHLDDVKWGKRSISFRDEQVLSQSFLYEFESNKRASNKDIGSDNKDKQTKKKSKAKSKKEKRASIKEAKTASNDVSAATKTNGKV